MKWNGCVVLPVLLLAGCINFSSPPAPDVKTWPVEPAETGSEPVRPMEGEGLLFSATRLGGIVVNAPYDRTQFTVKRADGTVAFDHYNVFAAAPSTLLRATAQNRLAADGRLGRVVNQASVVTSDAQIEVVVKDLSIDCREAGHRAASAAVAIDVVKFGRGPRTVAYSGEGSAAVDAQDGNYSRAFSQAFSQALDAAVIDALGPRKK